MDLSSFCQQNLLYTQESLSRYRAGGYHPVTLGDTFKDGRYKVHHKLGWGGSSTVWLAYDRDRNEWVSLKIMIASSQGSREAQSLQHLEKHTPGNLSMNYIVQLLDCFSHHGPNGIHQCLVFELLGPVVDIVLADYNEGCDNLDPEIVLRMSTQLLRAIKFIHSAGMCHGDISGRNIAITCNQSLHTPKEELLEVIGAPQFEPLARLDGVPLPGNLPTQLVQAAEWDKWIYEDEEDIRLLDFGESFLQGEEPESLAQPVLLRVPEIIFTGRFDHRVDLWRAGCMFYEFMFTSYPFWHFGEDEVLVLQMICLVEKLPAEWQPKWEKMKMDSKRTLEGEGDEKYRLERMFADKVKEPMLAPLVTIVQGLMRFLPSSRITVDEALDLLKAATE